MRVLLDECVTSKLKSLLKLHVVSTVQEEGWSGKKNGELLGLAQQNFDAFLTIDQNLRFQQSLAKYRIAVIVVAVPRNRLRYFGKHLSDIEQALSQVSPGENGLFLIGN